MRRLSRYGWQAAEPARRPVLFVKPRSGGGRAARQGWSSGHASEGSTPSSSGRTTTCQPSSMKPWPTRRMRSAWPVTGRSASRPRRHGPTGLPFICVPAGTRNHFALDVGVDRRYLVAALDAFGDHGVERSIDVAEVNGRVFLANVSLGIYGEAVRETAYRDANVRTLLETTTEVLGPCRAAPEVRLVKDLGREHRHPAVVLVSNNPYALDRPVAPGTRPRLDGDELSIVVLDRARPGADPPARVWSATHLAVDATAPVHAGVDGEAVELDPPLSLVIRPGTQRVRISSRHPGVSPSGRLA